MRIKFKLLYAFLLTVRLHFTIYGQSYIHPDEYFQNSEIAFNLIFNHDLPLFTSWEWNPESPCRSIIPVGGTLGIGFGILKLIVGNEPSANQLFVTQRLTFFFLSLIIDYTIWILSNGSQLAALLFACSPLAFTFLLRPFSNSTETILFGLILVIFPKVSQKIESGHLIKFCFGCLIALGIWTRMTFIAFILPLVLVFISRAGDLFVLETWTNSPLLSIGITGLPVAIGVFSSGILLATIDTIYFTGSLHPLLLTPLNSFLFNTSTENLASHGIHPRYLHMLVNWPLLFGPGIWCILDSSRPVIGVKRGDWNLNLATFWISTLLLSIQPHQEPRFLLPLIIPLILIVARSRILVLPGRSRTIFWVIWILHSSIIAALFGFYHQGGVIPAIFKLNEHLQAIDVAVTEKSKVEIIFWKTFMPPRHLVIPISTNKEIIITDLAGATKAIFATTLADKYSQISSTNQVLLVAPGFLLEVDQLLQTGFFEPIDLEKKTYGFQWDFDHLMSISHLFDQESAGIGIWKMIDSNAI